MLVVSRVDRQPVISIASRTRGRPLTHTARCNKKALPFAPRQATWYIRRNARLWRDWRRRESLSSRDPTLLLSDWVPAQLGCVTESPDDGNSLPAPVSVRQSTIATEVRLGDKNVAI